jgi:KipI family sensor histidine kinase inhibitor
LVYGVLMGLYAEIRYLLMGDQGLLLEFGDEISPEIHHRVRTMALTIEAQAIPGVVETVPTYRSLLVLYDPFTISLAALKERLREIEQAPLETPLPEPRLCRIPVLYGGSYGPDLQGVAQYHGITEEEVVRLHCSRPYLVYLIGFMPGFPYMGELPSELITPRLKTPRLVVPAGSVAIAQRQTGIYPMDSPGGWHLLGKTPVRMFDPKKDPPSYLRMGDLVEFYPISEKEFEERNEWEGHTA